MIKKKRYRLLRKLISKCKIKTAQVYNVSFSIGQRIYKLLVYTAR